MTVGVFLCIDIGVILIVYVNTTDQCLEHTYSNLVENEGNVIVVAYGKVKCGQLG